jgi:hydroxyethylthiazole kinase
MINAFERLKKTPPLVHNITNYVTVNDVANMILATGGAPLMADDQGEVEEIVSISSALYINVGTLNARTIDSMVLAGKKANALKIPVILDPVGVGASTLRNSAVERLVEEVEFAVIKGNISEIKAMITNVKNAGGVDVQAQDLVHDDNLDETIHFLQGASKALKTVIVASGAIDIATDGKETALIRNGDPMMAKITGTGCMLGSVIATYCGANKEHIFEATVGALTAMGLSGQYAADKVERLGEGIASFRTYLIDAMSMLTIEQFEEGEQVELR